MYIQRQGWKVPSIRRKSPTTLRTGYRVWTAEDNATIQQMLAEGKSVDDIAEALDRTLGAVRTHCHLQGWSTRRKQEPRPKAPPVPRPQVEVKDPYRGTDRRV